MRREPAAAAADGPALKKKTASKKSTSKKASSYSPRLTSTNRGAGYGVTKREAAAYFRAVAEHILPGVVRRALAVGQGPYGEGGA